MHNTKSVRSILDKSASQDFKTSLELNRLSLCREISIATGRHPYVQLVVSSIQPHTFMVFIRNNHPMVVASLDLVYMVCCFMDGSYELAQTVYACCTRLQQTFGNLKSPQ